MRATTLKTFNIFAECANVSIESATVNGRSVNVYDDAFGKLWIVGNEYGPTRIVRAQTFQDAYEIHIDESPTIKREELPEAYGFYLMQACRWNEENSAADWYVLSEHAEHVEMVSERVLVCTGDRRSIGHYPTKEEALEACLQYIAEQQLDLIEGYEYQSNASNTGIVGVSHYEWCRELKDMDAFELTLSID